MAMDYSGYVDTTLVLNAKPLRLFDDSPNKQAKTKYKEVEIEKKLAVKEEAGSIMEELNRANAENEKLTEMLRVVCENYNALRNQLMEYMNKNPEKELSPISKKRKSESSNYNSDVICIINGISDSSSSDEDSSNKKLKEEPTKAKTSKACVRTEASDTSLIVKDGYLWRKYGQKVTRDNPFPRAYYKCSFAPSCPVKKKVQRSVEDRSMLVATYEGEHNHPLPSQQLDATSGSNRSMSFSSLSGPNNNTLELTKPKTNNVEAKTSKSRIDSPGCVRQFLVEQMASSLTKDPNFTAALAAAISGTVYQQRT